METLDSLFEKWEQRYPNDKFIYDGIINESLWNKAKWKILFLLKELNLAPRSYSDHLPSIIQKDFRLTCNQEPWKEIGQWAYALLHYSARPSFTEAKQNCREACRSIAIANFKKVAGGNSSSASQIQRYARQDKEFLQKQINIIGPDIIVCCGKNMAFNLAKELFDDANNADFICSQPESEKMLPGSSYRGDRHIWIDFVHPSMRKGSRELKYNSLLNLMLSYETNKGLQGTAYTLSRSGGP